MLHGLLRGSWNYASTSRLETDHRCRLTRCTVRLMMATVVQDCTWSIWARCTPRRVYLWGLVNKSKVDCKRDDRVMQEFNLNRDISYPFPLGWVTVSGHWTGHEVKTADWWPWLLEKRRSWRIGIREPKVGIGVLLHSCLQNKIWVGGFSDWLVKQDEWKERHTCLNMLSIDFIQQI